MYRGLTLNLLSQDAETDVDAPSEDAVDAMAESPDLSEVAVAEGQSDQMESVMDDGLDAADTLDEVAGNLEEAAEEDNPQISPAAMEALLVALEPIRRRVCASPRARSISKESFAAGNKAAQHKRNLKLAAEGLKEAAKAGRDMVVNAIRALIKKFKEIWAYLTDQDVRLLSKAKKILEAAKSSNNAGGEADVDFGASGKVLMDSEGVTELNSAGPIIQAWDTFIAESKKVGGKEVAEKKLLAFSGSVKSITAAAKTMANDPLSLASNVFKMAEIFTYDHGGFKPADKDDMKGQTESDFVEYFVSPKLGGFKLLLKSRKDGEVKPTGGALEQFKQLRQIRDSISNSGIYRIDAKTETKEAKGKNWASTEVMSLAQAAIAHTESRMKTRDDDKSIEKAAESMMKIIEEMSKLEESTGSITPEQKGTVNDCLALCKAGSKNLVSSATRSMGAIRSIDAKMTSAVLDFCATNLSSHKNKGSKSTAVATT